MFGADQCRVQRDRGQERRAGTVPGGSLEEQQHDALVLRGDAGFHDDQEYGLQVLAEAGLETQRVACWYRTN